MPATLLTLLAAKAKATALVAATVGVTAAAVGGGTLAMQSVSDSSEISEDVTVEAPPETETPLETEPVESPAADADEIEDDGSSAEDEVEPVAPPAPIVAFTCDPSKNHGQNVSGYAKSLPKGPGRGALVSEVAKSDCGKPVAVESDEAPEVEAPEVEAPEVEAPETDQDPGDATTQKAPKGKPAGKASGASGGKGKKR